MTHAEITITGRFFEVLIGVRPEPIWQLLSKVGILYTLEPIFTIIFVINMNSIWEKVMSSLRAQIFQRVLIQKVNHISSAIWWLKLLWLTIMLPIAFILYMLVPDNWVIDIFNLWSWWMYDKFLLLHFLGLWPVLMCSYKP